MKVPPAQDLNVHDCGEVPIQSRDRFHQSSPLKVPLPGEIFLQVVYKEPGLYVLKPSPCCSYAMLRIPRSRYSVVSWRAP